MKRRFADGDFRGALELAEQLLQQRADDDVAEAVALASRAELATATAPAVDPQRTVPPPPDSAYDVEVDVDVEIEDFPEESATARIKRPELLGQWRSGGNARPTTPPRFSPSTPPLPLDRTPLAPPAQSEAPDPTTEHLDDAWEEPAPPSADTLVLGLERQPPAATESIEDRDQRRAREMYDLFVAGRFAEALQSAQRVLAVHPSEPLAQAIQSESKVALRRAQAIVVQVMPPAELAARSFDARTSLVVSWVDGHRSVAEIAQACGLSLPTTLSVLDDLRLAGVLVLSALDE